MISEELRQYLDLEITPVEFEGKLLWSDELSLGK